MNAKTTTALLTKVAKLNKGTQLKTMPILGHVKLTDGRAMATDLTIAISVTDPTIKLSGIVAADKISKGLDVIQRNFGLVNNKEYSVADFPELPTTRATAPLSRGAIASILAARGATSDDSSRPILTGIQLKDGASTATDGYRLISTGGGHTMDEVIIPGVVADLIKLSKETDGWNYGRDGESVVFENGNVAIHARAIDGNYPDWKKLIPESTPYEMQIEVAPILEALTLVDNANIRFDAKTGQVFVIDSGNSDRSTEATKTVATEGTHVLNQNSLYIIMPLKDTGSSEGQTLMNGRYFKDAVAKCKTVKVQFTSGLAPINIDLH